MRSVGVVAVLIAALAAACGSTAPPTAAGPDGSVVVEIAPPEPDMPSVFFEPIHRAQLIAIDGSIAAAWQVTSSAAPVRVQPGTYGLQVFTVFLSDTLVCISDPAAPGGNRCEQPTMGPGQVCTIDVVVVAERETRATFHALADGACGLEGAEPAAT